MATRRTRIKGIVNIPQRRKPAVGISASSEEVQDSVQQAESNLETACLVTHTQECSSSAEVSGSPLSGNSKEKNQGVSEDENVKNIADPIPDKAIVKPAQPSFRRRILKPAISLKAINRTNTTPSSHVPRNEEPHTPKAQDEPVPESASVSSCHVSESNDDTTLKNEVQYAQRSKVSSSLKLPCINNDCINKEISMLGITNLPPLKQASDIDLEASHEHDTNRPPPASSPSKFMNRARIKAVPRLGHRRPSFSIGSASESEDESKKTYKTLRVRNDSVCSSVSTPAPCESPAVFQDATCLRKKTEFNTVIQRKCKRTEQSRKLAEARRDFQMKFNNGKPDRQKLTMIDLIFYNPGSSPMRLKRKRKYTETSNISRQQDEINEEVDEPTIVDESTAVEAPQEAERSDEENTMPAPQITIGANGEIVIDEKSLFIENKELKRDRDALSKSTLVDGDNCNTLYGVFKRVKRSKDWSKSDTLRFYKALNTIGTDFTLMCELFPGRSRRELKMKFKKEERVNRALIDRAVMQPIQFDISDLQKELEQEELENLRKEQLKKDLQQSRDELRKSKETTKEEENDQENEQEPEVDVQRKPKKKRRRVCIRREMPQMKTVEDSTKEVLKNKLSQGINSLLDSDGEEQSKDDINKENNVQIESTCIEVEEVPVNNEQNHTNSNKNTLTIQDYEKTDTGELEEGETLVQGSIILSTVVDENGHDVYKVFTVNENKEKVAVDLTPEILEVLLRSQKDDIEPEVVSDTDVVVSATDDSVILPSDATIDNIMADISLSNIHDQSDLSMGTDCMILSFEDIDMPPPILPAATSNAPRLQTGQ